jgi:hypothetical protein
MESGFRMDFSPQQEQGRPRRLYSSSAGYYEHRKGARYINPITSGASFPDLVELHESNHAYLSLANLTDGLARLFDGVLSWGMDALSPAHKKNIDRLFQAIFENSVYTQELYATYTSFLIFASHHAPSVSRARRELPRFYKTILTEAEVVFGPVDAGSTGKPSIHLVNACAIAALNVRYPEQISFDDIEALSALVVENSPDKRFRRILHSMVSEEGVATLRVIGIQQDAVFQWIRSKLPDLKFSIFSENPTCFRDWAACLVRDAPRFGYRFLEDKVVQPHPDDTMIERLGARLEQAGMEPWEPLDLSLKRLKFASSSLVGMQLNGRACAEAGIGLFITVFVLPGKTLTHAFAFAWSSTERALVAPFSVTCQFDEFQSALREILKGGILLKIDERMGEQSARRLAETGHPCFVLAYDTRPRHILDVVLSASQKQQVLVSRLDLTDTFSVLLFSLVRDGYCFMAPATELGLELILGSLLNLNNVRFPDNQEETLAAMRIDDQRLWDLCRTCYAFP